MIHTYEEFTELLDRAGFMLFCGKSSYLSLNRVTDCGAWHTGGELDPWGWKDRMAQSRDGAYSHMFGGQGGFVSREWYPLFYSAYSVDIEEQYGMGMVPRLAMDMWRLFYERPTWGRHELRYALAGRFDKKSAFEAALRYLEGGMLITISGQVQPLSLSGRPVGWQAMEYSRTDSYLADWIADTEPDAARARQIIRKRAYENSPSMTEADFMRCFGRT